jgi:hypothetical protein
VRRHVGGADHLDDAPGAAYDQVVKADADVGHARVLGARSDQSDADCGTGLRRVDREEDFVAGSSATTGASPSE